MQKHLAYLHKYRVFSVAKTTKFAFVDITAAGILDTNADIHLSFNEDGSPAFFP